MDMVFSLFSMVVNQFKVEGISSFKTKNNAPVGTYRHRPPTLPIALERAKAIPRNFQSLRSCSSVENRKDSFNRLQQIRAYSTTVARL